jgi:hypothetical protein
MSSNRRVSSTMFRYIDWSEQGKKNGERKLIRKRISSQQLLSKSA